MQYIKEHLGVILMLSFRSFCSGKRLGRRGGWEGVSGQVYAPTALLAIERAHFVESGRNQVPVCMLGNEENFLKIAGNRNKIPRLLGR